MLAKKNQRMMKKMIFTSVFFLISQSANTCINEYEKIPGIRLEAQENVEIMVRMPEIDRSELEEFIKTRELRLSKHALDSTDADLVAAYFYMKDFSRALKLSEKLYTKFPNTYNVVINHAVALELNERYEEALKILKKAIKINPDSHHGSEWMHVKILEFLVSGSNDYSRSILGFDFGNDTIPKPVAKVGINMVGLEFQLNERIYFVKKPNKLFGSLLFDLGNLVILNKWEAFAPDIFGSAREYGFDHPNLKKRSDYAYHQINGEVTTSYNTDTPKTRTKNEFSKHNQSVPTNTEREIKKQSLFESTFYNRTLIIGGLLTMLIVVGGFTYVLTKSK